MALLGWLKALLDDESRETSVGGRANIGGWRKVRDTPTEKKWVKGDDAVEVSVGSGTAQAKQYGRTESFGNRSYLVLTNGRCTVPEAAWVAKLYMRYGIVLPACPVRVPADDGVRFTSVDISLIKEFVETVDQPEPDAVQEFLRLAGEGDIETIIQRGGLHRSRFHEQVRDSQSPRDS